MDEEHDEGCQYVDDAHDRDQFLGDGDDAFSAAEEADGNEDCEHAADDPGRDIFIVETIDLEGRLQVV